MAAQVDLRRDENLSTGRHLMQLQVPNTSTRIFPSVLNFLLTGHQYFIAWTPTPHPPIIQRKINDLFDAKVLKVRKILRC